MSKTKYLGTRADALVSVAEYIIDCENGEYDSYVSYCEENDLDPVDIRGADQAEHVYALALIGLGLEFPNDNDNDSSEDESDDGTEE